MTNTVRIIIQARVGSLRLPGKILALLAGEPMLAHVVRRLGAAQEYTPQRLEIVVATTKEPDDDATVHLCERLAVKCFRGATTDVLARYVKASADLAPHDIVVRATADNPLYCPRRTAMILDEHLAAGAEYTCVTNLSYVVPEVIQVDALRRMAELAHRPYCREHVTPYLRQKMAPFRVRQLPEDWQGLRPDIRLTVDTPEEYQQMSHIFMALRRVGPLFSLEEAYAHCSLQGDPTKERVGTLNNSPHSADPASVVSRLKAKTAACGDRSPPTLCRWNQ